MAPRWRAALLLAAALGTAGSSAAAARPGTDLAPIAAAADSNDWLHTTFPPTVVEPTSTSMSDLAAGAALDIVCLYRLEIGAAASTADLAARLDLGAETVRRARCRAASRGDGASDAEFAADAALLLRLRALEAIAARLGRDVEGLAYCANAESVAARLQAGLDDLSPGPAAVLSLAAGLRPGHLAGRRLNAALYEEWRSRLRNAPNPADAWLDFHLLHVLAPGDSRLLDDLRARPARGGWERTLSAVAAEARSGRLHLFRADDPARRLTLAVDALCRDGVLASWTVAAAARLGGARTGTPQEYAAAIATLDSLESSLSASGARAVPIHGSRQNYYRPTGQAAPTLQPAAEERARQTALGAVAALRARSGARLLADLGTRVAAEVDPQEIVPGQGVAAVWSLWTAKELQLSDWKAEIAGAPAGVKAPPERIAAGDSTLVRTTFAELPDSFFGAVLAPSLRLGFRLAGWGDVVLEEPAVVRVVAPVQATLVPLDGPLMHADRKSVEICVTSRSPAPISGTLHVLSTNGWTIAPSRSFSFRLRRPAESVRQRLEIGLPRPSSPGSYDLAVRLEVDGRPLETLRTQLVEPIEWAVVGPFATPARGRALPPESGVNLQSRYAGAGGIQVAWQVAPEDAYDTGGGLDFATLFPGLQAPACACACTVFESAEAGPATLWLEGAARASWNGRAPGPRGEVHVESGRNTLLVRSCSEARGWRLRAALYDPQGDALRSLANDQARLVEGWAALGKAVRRTGLGEPADRIVRLRFRASAAQGVAVLGAFNAWVPLELERQPDGSWQRDLRLSPGRYAYKLLVDGRLRPDPEAFAFEPDGFGGRNSLLIVP